MRFLCALALSMTALSTALAADVYPNKSITMIAAFPAGGPTDTNARLLGKLMYSAAKFDPLTDLVPVARTVGVPLVVAVNPSVPAGDLNALSELAKSKPAELNYASSGTGTIDHLAGPLLAKQLDIDMMHVPPNGRKT